MRRDGREDDHLAEPAAADAAASPARSWRVWVLPARSAILIAAALLLWAGSFRTIDVSRLTDLGLISVLPLSIFIALTLLSVSFFLALREHAGHRTSTGVMLLHVGALILMLYGITIFAEHGINRFAATYKHIGITQYILNAGAVNPNIDAYFNWPGFFILGAFVARIAGVHSITEVALWAPVFYNALYLGPMLLILNAATGDRRLVWLGVWFFYLANWVGQDYFSPQGLDFFLYLAALAIVLTWFKAGARWPQRPVYGRYLGPLGRRIDSWLNSADAPNIASTPVQRAALVLIMMAIVGVTVPSHQLTPFAALASIGLLVIFNRSSLRLMPIFLIVTIGLWLSFMAEGFLSGHFNQVSGQVGSVSSTVNSNLLGRLSGNREHVIVVTMGLLLTLGVWGMAGLGALRSIRRGYWDLSFGLLFVAPFTLALVQSYEGELALRVYLFALPAAVFFAAALFFTTPRVGRSWWTTLTLIVVSQFLFGAFFVSRFGNERMDYFTKNEIAAVNYLYDVARPHSLLLAGSDNIPWRFRDYTKYTTTSIDDPSEVPPSVFKHDTLVPVIGAIEDLLSNRKYPDHYFIITRSEKAYANLFGVYRQNTLDRIEYIMTHSPRFRLIYRNADAVIFKLAPKQSP